MVTAYAFEEQQFRPLDWPAGRALRWAAWRPDGSAALLAGNGGSALLYDGTRTEVLTTTTRQNLRGAAWSPDGMTALLVGNRGAVLRVRGEAVEELETSTTENLRRVAWHPSGAYALIVGNAGTVLRYDRAGGALAPLPADRAHTLRSVGFRPDGAYALVGAYASRWAGYPRPHAIYRCDGRFLQALLGSDDEDDFVSIDWRQDGGIALVCGYARRPDGSMVNKALLYDGSAWQTTAWKSGNVVLGGGWQPGGGSALLVGEGGLAVQISKEGGMTELESDTKDNLIGPFWRPDGAYAIVLKGPGERVYTV